MKPVYVIYDRANERYLQTGASTAPIFEFTPNVLEAHTYTSQTSAQRRGTTIAKQTNSYLEQVPNHLKETTRSPAIKVPVLEIHELSNPTVTVVQSSVQPTAKRSGYAVLLEGTWYNKPMSYYYRAERWMLDRTLRQAADTDSRYTYDGIYELIAHDNVLPKLWKTTRVPAHVIRDLEPLLKGDYWELKATVVEYTE